MATPTLVNHYHTPSTGIPNDSVSANNEGIASQINVALCDPVPAGGGNTIVLSVRMSAGVTIGTPYDDMGNTWSIATGTACTDSTNHVQGVMYYALNCAAGTRKITIPITGYLTPTLGNTVANVILGQWCNVATSSAYDGGSSNVHTSTTSWTSGSFTPTASGDLIVTTGFTTNSAPANSSWAVNNGSDGTTFTLLSADIVDSFCQSSSAFGIQTTAGAITTGYTLGTAHAGILMACAFKAASAGTPRPPGIQIIRIQGQSQYLTATSTTINWQFPCSGNLLVSALSCGPLTTTVPQITSNSTNWTIEGTDEIASTSDYWTAIEFLPNVTNSSGTYSGTLTSTAVIQQSTFYFYDIGGAATSPLGAHPAGSTVQVTTYGTIANEVITPSQANSLCIAICQLWSGTGHGCCGDPSLYFFDYPTIPQSTDVVSPNASPFAENNCMAHAYSRSTSQLKFLFATTAGMQAGSGTENVYYYGGSAIEFLAATPTSTIYPVAPPPTSPVTLTGVVGLDSWFDWQAPYGATSVSWAVYGSGGASGNVTTASRGGGGGGSGGYSSDSPTVSSTAQNYYVYQLGGGGWNNAGVVYSGYPTIGVDDSALFCQANAGTSAAANATAGGAAAAAGTGTVARAGAAGGAGGASVDGGGGAGAAGPTAAGTVGATGTSGGAGGAAGGGVAGTGGHGATSAGTVGSVGGNYGAGAGGSRNNTSGSVAGANGGLSAIVITWTMPALTYHPWIFGDQNYEMIG